jgi:hypothetical protein
MNAAIKCVFNEAAKEGDVVIRALKERDGQCFKFALRGLLESYDAGMRDVTLVHGVITGYHRDRVEPGHELRIAHAWLERGDMLYDATVDMVFPLADYYQGVNALAERRYSAEEAMLSCMLFSTDGPWHETAGVFT